MTAPWTSGFSVELLLRVIDVKYVALLYFTLLLIHWLNGLPASDGVNFSRVKESPSQPSQLYRVFT